MLRLFRRDGEIGTVASAETELAIDIDGYLAPAAAGGLSLYPVPPCRVLDRSAEPICSSSIEPPLKTSPKRIGQISIHDF